VPDIICCRCK